MDKVKKPLDRKRIELTELQWEYLERTANTTSAAEMLAEFWRVGLGYTTSEWNNLPAKRFRVWDYELSHADHGRLYSLMPRDSKRHRNASALAWLNIGPACEEPYR